MDRVAATPGPSRGNVTDAILGMAPVIRACCEAYGEGRATFGSHDAAKRLYRMGWRLVAEPELSTCSKCRKENVVTSQSVCIDCAGFPSSPRATP